MKINMFHKMRFGSLLAVTLVLAASSGLVQAKLQITSVFYGWDEKAQKFQNSNVVIQDNSDYTPLVTKLLFDDNLFPIPDGTTPSGYTCGSAQETSLAGIFALQYYFEDTDGGDGFQESQVWSLVPCDKNADDGTPNTVWPQIGGKIDAADLNNLPAFNKITDPLSPWASFQLADDPLHPDPDHLVIQKDPNPPHDPLIDTDEPCTTGNCLLFKQTLLGVNLDVDCDNIPDDHSSTGGINWGDYYIKTPSGGWADINGGICFYAELQKPGPAIPNYQVWKGPLQARIGDDAGDKTVNYNLDPTRAEIKALRAVISESGEVAIEWQTRVEVGTEGFYLERYDEQSQRFVRVNDEQMPSLSLLGSRQGGSYSIIDPVAQRGDTYSYQLVEAEIWDSERIHGPYEVTVNGKPSKDATKSSSAFKKVYNNGRNSASARVLTPQISESTTLTKASSNSGKKPVEETTLQTTDVATSSATSSTNSGKKPVEPTPEPSGAVRFDVNADAFYEVSAASIAAAVGESLGSVKKSIGLGNVALFNMGAPVPWEPAAGNNGIRLYATGVANNYTTTNVYWLELGSGEQISTTATGTAAPVDGQVISAEVRLEEDVFPLTEAATDPDSDYWRWAGMQGGAPSANVFTASVDLHNLAIDSTASLTIDLQSTRDVTNSVKISINGQLIGAPAWSGATEHSVQVTIPAGVLSESNSITVEAQSAPEGVSYVYVDGMTLSYKRLAIALDGVLKVVATDESSVLSLDGFGNSDIAVYKLGASPQRLEGVGVDTGTAGNRATFVAEAGATYLAVEAGAEIPLEAQSTVLTVYDPSENVDYLVIARRGFQSAEILATHRSSTSGLNTRVVWVDEIDTIINHGVSSPYNIREFLNRTAQDWGVRYAVLAGDACSDYRGLTGLCSNLVSTMLTPTPYGLYACDSCLGDRDGDLPDVRIGRIPAGSDAALLGYIDKLRRYEESNASSTAGVFLVADKNDPNAGFFKEDTEELASQLTEAGVQPIETLFLDDVENIETARTTMQARLEENGLWSNFIGHGGGTTLSNSDLLVGGDSELITGGSGVLSAMTCIAAWHDSPYFQSLTEELVLDPDGGPVVAYAPSGLSLNGEAVKLNSTLLDEVFAQNNLVIGDAVAETMLRNKDDVDDWMRKIYQIIGDVYLQVR